ncbi:MAG: dienelactone hydrolase family protein, partial [Myxococcales bacterium]|nr:dienelactone hydrolase family protein [Myxococcales bacterium]
MSDLVNVTRPDGKTCPAYVKQPEGAAKGGVVVIQEWWGLNDQIKKTADRVAAQGYVAVVPDLYRGKIAKDADEANHSMQNLDFGDAANQDVRGAIQYLKAQGVGKVAVMGFCMGGALTILSAVHVEEVDAGICFYGIPPAEFADPATIEVPMQLHFATDDDWCNAAAVSALEAKLKEGGVDHELFRYEGTQHAFMNEARPEVHDAAAAELAYE